MFKSGFTLQVKAEDVEESMTTFVNKRLLPEYQISNLKLTKVDGEGDAALYTFEATPVQASAVEVKE